MIEITGLNPISLGELEGEIGNLGKRLELRDRDETWWVELENVVDT